VFFLSKPSIKKYIFGLIPAALKRLTAAVRKNLKFQLLA